MDAIAIPLIVAIVALVLVTAIALKAVIDGARASRQHDEVLIGRLLEAYDTGNRAEVANLLAIAGLGPDPNADVADRHRAELYRELERQHVVDPVGDRFPIYNHPPAVPAQEEVATGHGQDPRAPMIGLPEPFRYVMPEAPASDFEDPTDLTQPLDDVGGYLPPGGSIWGVPDPAAFTEPVPEQDGRVTIMGFGVDENPLSDLGIEPAWREEHGGEG